MNNFVKIDTELLREKRFYDNFFFEKKLIHTIELTNRNDLILAPIFDLSEQEIYKWCNYNLNQLWSFDFYDGQPGDRRKYLKYYFQSEEDKAKFILRWI